MSNHAFTIIPLTIEARGEIITNNLPEFRNLVREALGNINRDLKSDEQFGQAELDVKALKEAEDAVRTAAVKAFDDQLKALVDGLNETAEEIRVPRLELEKLIAKRKEDVKSEIVAEYLAAFDIDPATARKHHLTGLQTQIKGKRTLESMRTACRVYQTTQQALIQKCRGILASFEKAHGADLIMDRRELELERPESLEAELRRRFEAKRAADERKRLEEAAEAARAAEAKAKAELEASKQPAKPTPLPIPPSRVMESPWKSDGSAKVDAPARPESNVIPFSGPVTKEESKISEVQEWKQMTEAVIVAFTYIKERRETLTHEANRTRMLNFGSGVNALWKEINAKEVAS